MFVEYFFLFWNFLSLGTRQVVAADNQRESTIYTVCFTQVSCGVYTPPEFGFRI